MNDEKVSIRKDIAEKALREIGDAGDMLVRALAEIGKLRSKLADTEAARQHAETERDQLWDACLAEGHSPDPHARGCRQSLTYACVICARMEKMPTPSYENPPAEHRGSRA